MAETLYSQILESKKKVVVSDMDDHALATHLACLVSANHDGSGESLGAFCG
jgi:hypothetical protein